MVKEWMKWCRLCAREDSSNTHVNIFFEDEKGLPLSDTINKCFSIDINHFNNWPIMICVHCFSLLKSIITLAQRTSKVNAMFAELLDCLDNIDPNKVKVRYDLHTISDIKFDLKVAIPITTVNDFELTDLPSEMNEQMVDVGELKYIDSDLVTTSIKTEEVDIDDDIGHKTTQDEESSQNYGSLGSDSDSSVSIKPKKRKYTKRKFKPQKEKKPKNESIKNEEYHCSDCDKGFIKQEMYRRHMLNTHDTAIQITPKLLICETCGKEYKSQSGLNDHRLTHTEERKHKCRFCDKKFKAIAHRKRHEDTHNETKYICVVCGLQLNTQRTLNQHMIVHSEEKKHKCDLCGKEYKRAKALKYHLITHAGLRPYFCDFCEKTFTNAANCRIHKRRHHPVEFAEQEATGLNKTSNRIPKMEDLKALLDGKKDKITLENHSSTMEAVSEIGSTSAINSDTRQSYLPTFLDNLLAADGQSSSKNTNLYNYRILDIHINTINPMVKQWMKWCRLCAREDSNNTHVNVFFEDEKGLPLSDTINKCFSIDINHFNDWPNMICVQCYFLAKSILNLSQRTSKVHAMFAELLDGDDDIDAYKVKVRYELHTMSDVKFDLKVPVANAVELPEMPIEMNEQMIDVDELHYVDSDVLNTTAIKTEEADEDYLDQSDRIPSAHGDSSDEDGSLKSEVLSDDYSPGEKPKKRKKEETQPKKRHNRRRMQTEPIKCEKCPKSFFRIQFHRRHMKKAHGITVEDTEPKAPLEFVCEECGKKCKTYWALRDHQLTHSTERPLKCTHCDKLFKNKQTLKIHEDIHNETNYICVVCGLKLNTRRTLRMHMVVHSDQKQHKCDYCGNEYKRAKALKNHLILHTGLKPYTCDFCDRTFANGSNCRSHKKKSHPVELAAMEAAGKNSIAAGIPKLEDLRAKTKAEANQPKKSETDVNECVGNENKPDMIESLNELKSMITIERSVEFDHGVFGSMSTS
ncbi:gastrula zinc finger protein xFG20-1-like [Episyrphus balteatus]|uniref:gastrula zinc finger protein xFG20-1-like n=1 Tax=Episyrphus balteatus TaxID=286459 RepID=UPI0024868D5B|nr:gastrula zinc finger protein xFG20-1-like [Episyrphus balteatus]